MIFLVRKKRVKLIKMSLKDNDNSDIVSAIVPTKVNNRLLLMFKERNIPFISHRKKILIRVNISVRVSYN